MRTNCFVRLVMLYMATCWLLPLHAQLRLTENKGQWTDQIRYRMDLTYGNIYVEQSGLLFDMSDPEDLENIHYIKENSIPADPDDVIIRKHAWRMTPVGMQEQPAISTSQPSADYSNYFIGNDPDHWASSVRHFSSITIHDVFPHTNMQISSHADRPKYELTLYPGANLHNIAFVYSGLDSMHLKDGALVMQYSFGQVIDQQPVAWQIVHGKRVPVPCRFTLKGDTVGFVCPSGYQTDHPLIIDPEMVFASYSGSTSDNWGYTATYDQLGHMYGGGIVFGSGYPTTTGAYDVSFSGGSIDMGLTKFTPDGSDLVWSTYLGGSGQDLPHSMVVNSAFELLVYGTTSSPDFPMTPDSYDDVYDDGPTISLYSGFMTLTGADIIIAKLSDDGTMLEGSTFMGGTDTDGFNLASATQYNYGDHSRGEIVVDAADNIYVASSTSSDDFPITAGSFDNSYNGSQDAVVFCLNPDLSDLLWSTYLGGTSGDGAFGLKVSSSGQVVVTGGTASSGFPVTAGTWTTSYAGGTADGFVSILSADGSSLVASTYAGTSQYDQSYFVELDEYDNVYITGQSKGSFPVSAGVYSVTGGKQFIVKLNSSLTSVILSTVFGSGGSSVNISPSAFLVDECENIYVSGWGGSVNNSFNPATGNTTGLPTTADALDATTDGSDFYFFVLEKNMASLLYASFFGGSPAEHVDGGTSRFDKEGTIYQAVCAGCGGSDGFPTTAGAWSEVNGSFNCNLGVGKIAFNLAGVYAESDAEPSINGCAPFTVNFENLSSDAEEYIWDFGDGVGGSVEFEPIYTYDSSGTYTVMLVVIDSSTCNIADTSYLTVTVYEDSIFADFDLISEQDCEALTAFFSDSSDILDTTTWFWNFGDGGTSTLQNPEHTYTTPGTYEVMLVIYDPTSCNQYDTAYTTISFLSEFSEDYSVSTTGCLPLVATFTSEFTGADSYTWNFGDGTSGTGPTIIHTYEETGTYLVTLSVVSCGIEDITTFPVIVYGFPEAYFDSEPEIGLLNTPITFNNLSTGAVYYDWFFSDGGYSDAENAVHTFTSLGGYEICLTVTNPADCEDTYCRSIIIENEGVIGVPSGFSPNNDGSNDVLYVRGFGIETMLFQVYNRWGQLVFSTTDQHIGWDGTYQGVPQEVEVYIYTLEAEFMDGKTHREEGNITLIR